MYKKRGLSFVLFFLGFQFLYAGFTWSSISSPKKVGVWFSVTITADDPHFNKTANLYMEVDGEIEEYVRPRAVTFSNGKWEGNIMVTYAAKNVKLLCSYAGETGESNSFDVELGDPKRVQIIAPGENPAPGTDRGKTGSAEVIAGGKFEYKINICDTFWNQVSESKTVTLITTDPYGKLPESVDISGTGSVEIILRTAPEKESYQDVVVSAGGLLPDTAKVHVAPAGYKYLLIIAPGEQYLPGVDTLPGKSGTYETPQLGVPYTVTVLAIDSCYNRIWDAPDNQVVVVETDDGEIGGPATLYEGKAEVDILFQHKGRNTIWAEDKNDTKIKGIAFDYYVATGVAKVEVTAVPSEVPIGTPSQITATTYDDQNNPVPLVDVSFKVIEGDVEAVKLEPPSAKTDANGRASCTFTAEKAGTYVIEASSGGAKATVTITVKGGKGITIWPNPFKPSLGEKINIKYPVEVKANKVTIVIVDAFGNLVLKKEFTEEEYTKEGFSIFEWDAKNSKGVKVASGIYQVAIKVERQDGVIDTFRSKLLIIR